MRLGEANAGKIEKFALFQKFHDDRRGNFGIIGAVTAMVAIAAIGLAVDVSNSINHRSMMTSAADAAVLAGTVKAQSAFIAGDKDWLEQAKATAKAFFSANIGGIGIKSVSFEPTFVEKNGAFTGDATYQYSVPTLVMGTFGYDTVEVGQVVKASTQIPNFIDITYVIDNSGSMGIGAEVSDQQKMVDKTQCAFACHQPRNAGELKYLPSAARSANATLRIDVVKDSLQKALAELQQRASGNKQVRVAVYTFSNELVELVKPTTNLAAAQKKVEKLDLATSATKETGGTYFARAMEQLAGKLSKSGSGTSSSNRKSFVVLFTDGIEDSIRMYADAKKPELPGGGLLDILLGGSFKKAFSQYNSPLKGAWQGNKYSQYIQADESTMQPFSAAECNQLKNEGHTILATRIKYIAAVNFRIANWSYEKVDFIRGAAAVPLQRAFEDCVSKKEYLFTASTSAEIKPAFDYISKQIIDAKAVVLTD